MITFKSILHQEIIVNHFIRHPGGANLKEDYPTANDPATGAPLPEPSIQPGWGDGWRARLIMSVIAAAVAWLIGQAVYRDAPVTTDENSYVFQAHLFLEGRVKRPAPDCMDWFQSVMIVLDKEHGWFSRYPPAHSLWLAPGVLMERPRIMSAVAAGASVWLLTGVAALFGAPVIFAGLGLLLSPYFLFMHGTLLSHTSAMLAVALMLSGYAHWTTRRSPAAIAVAGCAWSFLYLDRPFTAALVAVPFGVDALIALWREPARRVFLGLIAFGGCAATGILLGLWYNSLTTGDPFLPPFVLYDSTRSSGLGFDGSHTPRVALGYLISNLAMLDEWLLGFHGGLLLYIALIWIGWTKRWSLFALSGILLIPGGHMLFCYPGVNTCGPFYYFESLPFFIILLALAGRRLRSMTGASRRADVRRALPAVVIIAAMLSGLFMITRGTTIRLHNATLAQLRQTTRSAPPDSIVLVENVDETARLDLSRLLFNPRGLASARLIIPGGFERDNFIAGRLFPGRSAFLLDGRAPDRLANLAITTQRLDRVIDVSASRAFTGQTLYQDQRSLREALAGRDDKGYIAWGNYMTLYPGSFEAVFNLECTGISSNAPAVCDLAADRGQNVLATRAVSGEDGHFRIILSFKIGRNTEVEPRIYYGGSGRLRIHSLAMRESE